MNLPQTVDEFTQKIRQLQIKRQKLNEEIQKNPSVESITQLNANLLEQKQIIQAFTANSRHQVIIQASEKTFIHSSQLSDLVSLFRTHYNEQYPHFSHPEPIHKISKLAEKYLTSEYDFTQQQVNGLLLYSFTYDMKRVPQERDFQLIQRIIVKFTQFNHFYYGYIIAFRRLLIMMQVLYRNDADYGLDKMVKILHIMHKFKLVEISINAIKHNHHPDLYDCLKSLRLYLLIVVRISRNYVNRDEEGWCRFLYKLNESDTNFVNNLGKLYMDVVPQCLQLMHTSTSPEILQILLQNFAYLSRFQRGSLEKKTFNIKNDSFTLQPLTQHNKLRPFQQQLAELMYQHGIVDWIMKNSDWLTSPQLLKNDKNGQRTLLDVLTVMELIVFRVTVKEFRDKLLPLILNLLLNVDFASLKYNWGFLAFNWLIQFVHCNAKPQNASLFREIFVESSLLESIEENIQTVGAYLEDNVIPSRQHNIQTIDGNSQKFVYRTILAIGIYRACDLPPSKVVLISADIVLQLLLNCYWLNKYMQDFLSEHPFADNKMEIQH